MLLIRALGWLLLTLAIAIAVHDGLFWWSDGAFHPMGLGDLWQQLDYVSLQSLEMVVSRHLSVMAWARIAAPILKLPALPVFVIVGLLLLWLGQSRDDRPEPGFLLNSRRPRRRRSRGSLL